MRATTLWTDGPQWVLSPRGTGSPTESLPSLPSEKLRFSDPRSPIYDHTDGRMQPGRLLPSATETAAGGHDGVRRDTGSVANQSERD